jgi:tetratricopeptide (TPR) repeat protein
MAGIEIAESEIAESEIAESEIAESEIAESEIAESEIAESHTPSRRPAFRASGRRWLRSTHSAAAASALWLATAAASAQAPAPASTPAPGAPAVAAPRDPAVVARADAAFEEGRELFDQGRFREACEKFELSMQLDPSPGTLLNLGNCYEPQGDLVRALAIFEQAFADAQRSDDPRRKELWTDAARERIANLSRRVPQLTVRNAPADAEVAIDGTAQRPSGALRINPGRHRIEVRAPGKRPFTQEFDVAVSQRLALNVPPLEADTGPAAPPPAVAPSEPPPPRDTAASTYGPWPYVLGGTGAALLGTSLVTGLMAKSKANELDRECDGDVCDESLQGTRDSAESLALATDVLWISGLVIAGAGVTLFILDANDDEAGTAVQAGCFGTGCGMLATGHF